jgi:hypothetical protein
MPVLRTRCEAPSVSTQDVSCIICPACCLFCDFSVSNSHMDRSGLLSHASAFAEPSYPTLVSADREDGTPIPFSGISGLSACPQNASCDSNLVFAIEDSAVAIKRILNIETSKNPPEIVGETFLKDSNGILSSFLASGGMNETEIGLFINDDGFITNIDLEGIATSVSGGAWSMREASSS